jgi:hypothetical protein
MEEKNKTSVKMKPLLKGQSQFKDFYFVFVSIMINFYLFNFNVITFYVQNMSISCPSNIY